MANAGSDAGTDAGSDPGGEAGNTAGPDGRTANGPAAAVAPGAAAALAVAGRAHRLSSAGGGPDLAPAAAPQRDATDGEWGLVAGGHGRLQSAALRTAFAGAVAGLLHAIGPGFGLWSSAASDALALLLVGLAAVPPRSLGSAALAALLASAAAAFGLLPPWASLLLLLACGGALYARDLEGGAGRRLAAATIGGAAVAGGLLVAEGLHAAIGAGLGDELAWLIAGGGAGFCAGLGVLGRQLELRPAAAALALDGAGPGQLVGRPAPPPSAHEGELGELLARAAQASQQASEALGSEAPAAARAAASLLQRVGGFAQRWRELDRQLQGTDRAALLGRAADLEARVAATTDEQARDQYQRAARALHQQIDDLDHIRAWQERSLARLHHHVAVLERLRLAALHRRSVATGRSGDELAELADELSTAGLELDGAAELLAELSGP